MAEEQAPEDLLQRQVAGDVREISETHLQGVDAVIHLAAISNDPMGSRFEKITEEINFRASLELARSCVRQGVRHFVFASSCSLYGFAEGKARVETDPLNPLTAYARSKAATEQHLSSMDLGDTLVTCLRFATACGASERLRLDLVLNDFVASALMEKKIKVLSDGSPWRPLIDVKDMARSMEWALGRDPEVSGKFLSVNVGMESWNFQVRDLANAVAAEIPDSLISINHQAPPDRRSYQVDFALFRKIAPRHQPVATLRGTIRQLQAQLQREISRHPQGFNPEKWMRLKTLELHLSTGYLRQDLRWEAGHSPTTAGIRT